MKRVCKDCGTEFELSEAEIGFYKSKGYEIPKRCKSCRDIKSGKISSGAMASNYPGSSSSRSTGGGNNKMIGILIAAIALVIVIGVIAAVKSLSKNSSDTFTANNSVQTNVSDLSNVNDDADSDTDIDADNISSDDAANNAGDGLSENSSPDSTSAAQDGTTQNNTQATQDNTATSQDTNPPAQETTPVEEEPAPVQVSYYFRNSTLLNQHYEKHGIEMGFDSAQSYQAAASAVINNPNALCKTEAEDGDYVYYVEATNEFVVLSTDGYIRTYFLPSGGKAYYDRQ